MALMKCPRCELNYILDGDTLCTVCKREVRGEVTEQDDLPELCSECGEAPTVPGSEFCLGCLKEITRRVAAVATEDTIDAIAVEDASLEIDSVSAMDEIQIDIGSEIDSEEFPDEAVVAFDDTDDADEDDDGDLFDR